MLYFIKLALHVHFLFISSLTHANLQAGMPLCIGASWLVITAVLFKFLPPECTLWKRLRARAKKNKQKKQLHHVKQCETVLLFISDIQQMLHTETFNKWQLLASQVYDYCDYSSLKLLWLHNVYRIAPLKIAKPCRNEKIKSINFTYNS